MLCADCFLVDANHKFKSTIGRERAIPYGTEVVLAYSGGPSSTAMLKLVSDALKEEKKAKLKFTVRVVHINLTPARNDDTMSSQNVLEQMSKLCQNLGFDLTIVEATEWIQSHQSQSSFSLPSFFDSSDDETLRIDREKNLIQTILRQYSSQNAFHWLMTGQSLFRSAVSALTEVTLGRGCMLPSFCKFLDQRDPNVSVFYPMKEFTSKEVALFNHFHSLTSFKFSQLEAMKDSTSSIQRLTEDFLLNLQIDFPAAAPNVRNSGDKMVPRSTQKVNHVVQNGGIVDTSSTNFSSAPREICDFCLMPLDIQTLHSNLKENARDAAQFSNDVCGLTHSDENYSSDGVSNICSFCKLDFIFE